MGCILTNSLTSATPACSCSRRAGCGGGVQTGAAVTSPWPVLAAFGVQLLTECCVYKTLGRMPLKKAAAEPIYNRVRVLRVERDMSRQQLADAVEVNVQTIGALERGDHNPSLLLAFRICEVFNLPVEAVFSLSLIHI